METAIIVDWDLYRTHPATFKFIAEREGRTRLVLLVPFPELNDYNFTEEQDAVHWDVIIRNTGDKSSSEFKYNAMSIIRDVSTTIPIIALDSDPQMDAPYKLDFDVLCTFDDLFISLTGSHNA